jgi:hypothetical protein
VPIEIDGTQTTDPTTHGNDAISAGASGGTGAGINLGYLQFNGLDEDVDVTASTTPSEVVLEGMDGNDTLTGAGNIISGNLGPANYSITAYGGAGNDQVNGGAAADYLDGGLGADRFFSVDHAIDNVVDGGNDGNLDFADVNPFDTVGGVERTVVESPVGKLKLSPAVIRARAGRPAAVNLAWKDPDGWKQLRTLDLRARRVDGRVVGTIAIDARHGRIHSQGALTATRASKVGHHGKTLTARLRLRAATSLAGHGLQLEVQATDVHGRQQLEPLAGRLAVSK